LKIGAIWQTVLPITIRQFGSSLLLTLCVYPLALTVFWAKCLLMGTWAPHANPAQFPSSFITQMVSVFQFFGALSGIQNIFSLLSSRSFRGASRAHDRGTP
jgi:hypothetical protein